MGFWVGELLLWVSAAMCAASKRTQDGGGEQTQCRRDLSHGPAAAGQGSTITLHPTHFEDVSSALVAQILNSGR